MLLTLTLAEAPASRLGYLLHKHPDRMQAFEVPFGRAHVFYPEAGEDRCTAALLLELDPVGLVRGVGGCEGPLAQYVNDRPYVASSFLAVAMKTVFNTAMAGRCTPYPQLPDTALPLTATVPCLPCPEGVSLLRGLFEPLGYTVEAQPIRDEDSAEAPRYWSLSLSGCVRLRDLLSHLYVLLPALDREKHYWIGQDEVEKLLRFGEGWLGAHPQRETIARRYLQRRSSLVRAALERLAAEDPILEEQGEANHTEEAAAEERLSLNQQRHQAVLVALKETGAARVLDLGCGEGRLLRELARDLEFREVVGLDVSVRALEVARERLDRLPRLLRDRVTLLHGALTYRDARLTGYDAAAVVEVIEHLDPPRLAAFERALFQAAQPAHVVLTTPNAEYNTLWPSLPAGRFRHRDHRFEWSRHQFREWAQRVAGEADYAVEFRGVGPEDPLLGPPTQMASFHRLKKEAETPPGPPVTNGMQPPPPGLLGE